MRQIVTFFCRTHCGRAPADSGEEFFPCGRPAHCWIVHTFSHQRWTGTGRRVVTGDKYKHHREMRASWNIAQCSCNACVLFCRGRGVTLQSLLLHVLPCRTVLLLALQMEPRRPRHQAHSTQQKRKVGSWLRCLVVVKI